MKWSKTIPKDATVVIGNYAYRSHGDQHVRLSLCADVLIQAMRKARPSTIVGTYNLVVYLLMFMLV